MNCRKCGGLKRYRRNGARGHRRRRAELLEDARLFPKRQKRLRALTTDERDLLRQQAHSAKSSVPREKIKRNDPCPCGSGKKFKRCHLGKEDDLHDHPDSPDVSAISKQSSYAETTGLLEALQSSELAGSPARETFQRLAKAQVEKTRQLDLERLKAALAEERSLLAEAREEEAPPQPVKAIPPRRPRRKARTRLPGSLKKLADKTKRRERASKAKYAKEGRPVFGVARRKPRDLSDENKQRLKIIRARIKKDQEAMYDITGMTPLIRDSGVVRALKAAYNNVCQMCGYRIETLDGRGHSEGAHILPFSDSGDLAEKLDSIENLLILCPTHHREFDLDLIEVKPLPDGEFIILHHNRDSYSPEDRNLIHKSRLFMLDDHSIDPLYLEYHSRAKREEALSKGSLPWESRDIGEHVVRRNPLGWKGWRRRRHY